MYTYGTKSKGKNSDPYSLFEARIQNRNWLIGLSSYHPNNINNYNILLLTSNFFFPKGKHIFILNKLQDIPMTQFNAKSSKCNVISNYV